MAREQSLRLVDLVRTGVKPWAVLMAGIPAEDLTAEEARDLAEARDLLCGVGVALRRLIHRDAFPYRVDAPGLAKRPVEADRPLEDPKGASGGGRDAGLARQRPRQGL